MTEGLNKVKIRGTILHVYRSEKNGTAVVTIGTGDNNRPNVTMLKGLAEYFIGEYKVGDMIMVEGNIQSTIRENNNKTSTNEKTIFTDFLKSLYLSVQKFLKTSCNITITSKHKKTERTLFKFSKNIALTASNNESYSLK